MGRFWAAGEPLISLIGGLGKHWSPELKALVP